MLAAARPKTDADPGRARTEKALRDRQSVAAGMGESQIPESRAAREA